MPAWEAVELAGDPHAEPRSSATPLIGREEELVRLDATLERVVREGAPYLLTVIGQPGVGKSRLLLEFETRLDGHESPPLFLHGRCIAFGQGGVYRSLIEMLRQRLRDRRRGRSVERPSQAPRALAAVAGSARGSRAG